jgi:hypothetical protein
MFRPRYSTSFLTSAIAMAIIVSTAATGKAADPVARYTAFAVNLGTPGRAGAGTVEIVVNRWSAAAERERLMTAMKEKGAEKLLDVLQDLPEVGYIRTPDSIGYPIHFAVREDGEDGGDNVTMITDRYISFWEAWVRPRTIDYPFTVIDMHISKDGEGEGKMSLATRIVPDRHGDRVILENYSSQPVLLQSVRQTTAKN